MDEALRRQWPMAQEDQRISEAVDREYAGLRSFIRKHVADQGEAEDILQDVFYELVEAYRLMKPVEQVTAWLFRVARNRIIDRFRRKKREALRIEPPRLTEEGDSLQLGRVASITRRWTGGCFHPKRISGRTGMRLSTSCRMNNG